MTLRDIRDEHKKQLQLQARKQLGFHSDIRVFRSAEGDLSPLTISDAASISRDLTKQMRHVKGETITIGESDGPVRGFKVIKP
jgi:hypothetical protein